MQQLIAKETARQLAMGDNILDPTDLPDFKVGSEVPKDLGAKYGTLCYNADGFAQVQISLNSTPLSRSIPATTSDPSITDQSQRNAVYFVLLHCLWVPQLVELIIAPLQ